MASSSDYHFSFPFVDGPQTIAIGTVLPLACVVIVILRLASRTSNKKKVGLDDWLIIFGLINVIGMGISLIVGAATYSMGYPTPKPPPGMAHEQLLKFRPRETVITEKVQYIFQLLMILAYGSIKASITLFYRHLFVTNSGTVFDIISKITLVVLGLWTLTFELIMIFTCGSHIKANWESLVVQSNYCTVLGFSSEYGMAVSDLILDLIVILMPLPWIWKLRLPFLKKLAITGTFLLGASAVGASIARLIFYLEILSASTHHIVADANLEIASGLYWSLLEAGLALIAACLPTLPLLSKGRTLKSTLDGISSHLSIRSTLSRLSNWNLSSSLQLPEKAGVVVVSNPHETYDPEPGLTKCGYPHLCRFCGGVGTSIGSVNLGAETNPNTSGRGQVAKVMYIP